MLGDDVSFLITSILSDNNARAEEFGSALTIARPAAVKTGTTEDYRDALTIGYTPTLAIGVWVGNNDNTPMDKAGGSVGAGPLWHAFMQKAVENMPVEQFPAPPANDAAKPVLRGAHGGGARALIDSVSGKLATSSTPKEYITEKIFL